jgi:hypothetical protein
MRVAGQARKALSHVTNERGRLLEIPILLALICISVAIGFGQYAKYGWQGFLLTTAAVFFGVIAAFAVLIFVVTGIAKANERLSRHGWYLTLRTVSKWLVLFLFFSSWGTVFTLGVGSLFGFDMTSKDPAWYFNLVPLVIGGIWLGVRRCFAEAEIFWREFWRFSGVLLLGGVVVFIGMLVGQGFFKDASQMLRFLQMLFFAPLFVYAVIRLILKKKTPEDGPTGSAS